MLSIEHYSGLSQDSNRVENFEGECHKTPSPNAD